MLDGLFPFACFPNQGEKKAFTQEQEQLAKKWVMQAVSIVKPLVLLVFGEQPAKYLDATEDWHKKAFLYNDGCTVVVTFINPTSQWFTTKRSKEALENVLKALNTAFEDLEISAYLDSSSRKQVKKWAKEILGRIQTAWENVPQSSTPSKETIQTAIRKFLQGNRATAQEIFDHIKEQGCISLNNS